MAVVDTGTFSLNVDARRPLDYARLRLFDIDPEAPWFYDETYLTFFENLGVQEATAQIASMIALRLTQEPTLFSEAGGIKVSFDYKYYSMLAAQIREEPNWEFAAMALFAKAGRISRGGVLDAAKYPEILGMPSEIFTRF